MMYHRMSDRERKSQRYHRCSSFRPFYGESVIDGTEDTCYIVIYVVFSMFSLLM